MTSHNQRHMRLQRPPVVFYARLRTPRNALEFDLNNILKTESRNGHDNAICLTKLRVFCGSCGHSLHAWCVFLVCFVVLEAAVHREQLSVHTLEDFHIPRCFEFGDRSPFEKLILCVRSIGQERKLCADLHSRVCFFSIAFHLRPCKGMLSF